MSKKMVVSTHNYNLYNLFFHSPANDNVVESLLNREEIRQEAMHSSKKHPVLSALSTLVLQSMKHREFKIWNQRVKNTVVKRHGKLLKLYFRREILSIFLANSCREMSAINSDAALC